MLRFTDRLKKLATDPGRYLPLIPKIALEKATRQFVDASFRLDSQMRIHPLCRWHDRAFTKQFGGFQLLGEPPRTIVNLEPWDGIRRDMLILLLRDLIERRVSGDIAELGVYKGHSAKLIHHYLPQKVIHLYDTFHGFDARDILHEAMLDGYQRVTPKDFSDTSVEGALKYIGPRNGNVHLHQGFFPECIPESEHNLRYCFIHLDADLFAPTMAGLTFFYPRVERGGFIVVHDFNAWPGARQATLRFFSDKPEIPIPMPDVNGSALVRKI